MGLGIGGDADLEIGDPLQAGDQIGGEGVAAGMRRVALADAARRIAAQRHDMADAGLPIGVRDRVDLGAGRGDAGQMRRRLSAVSSRMRRRCAWVRSRVEPPAP
jgi:hypothetical protein